jgi:hypothetical protein
MMDRKTTYGGRRAGAVITTLVLAGALGSGCRGSSDPQDVADADSGITGDGAGDGAAPKGDYPFQGYTSTRGAFQPLVEGQAAPRILVVDRLGAGSTDGDLTTGRGSLPWALARSFPRVIVFEVSGVIDVGGSLAVTSPYVSVHGQTAPSPGITLHHVEFLIATHDVILQHLRFRMGDTELGGGDSVTMCGAAGDAVHDVIIDHCSAGLGHDEQLSISSCNRGDVRRVTFSNNLISFGLNHAGHSFGTLIDSGGSNSYSVDEILIDGNLYSNVSYRTPMINHAARHVTVTNNTTYNAEWRGMQFSTAQYPEGQFIDVMNNLYWRGPETRDLGTWPIDEVATWPAQPDLWPWDPNRRWVSGFAGPSGDHTHVYYADNYDYVNNDDYDQGNHEGRPVRLEHQWYSGGITAADIARTSRQTPVPVVLLSPRQVEDHVKLGVGCTPHDRDAVDARAVSDALDRTGGYIDYEGDLGVPPVPTASATRTLDSVGGYPGGHEHDDRDGDGLTDLEEWIYAL